MNYEEWKCFEKWKYFKERQEIKMLLKKYASKKQVSVKTISGGLPSLGKKGK